MATAVQTMDPRQGHLPPSPPKEDPLASLRQRMAEKRAEIDANLSPSARARNGFDDDDDVNDDAAADAFPPQPPPPVSTEPPMKSVELALDDFDVASLKRNLELAIATIREMQQRLVASNRAIETATAERNAARRDLARAERDVQRLAAAANARARQHESERDLLAARHASERRESLERQRAEHAQELNAQLAESQAAQEAQSREIAALAADLRTAQGKERGVSELREKLSRAEALNSSAKERIAALETAEVDLGKALAAKQNALEAQQLARSQCEQANQKKDEECARADRAEQCVDQLKIKCSNLDRDVAALRADAQIRDAAQKSFQADCARERDALTQMHGAERERAVDAEKREKRLQKDLAKLSKDHARSQSAHKGARHALERARAMTEQDVAGLLASRREAVTDLAAMRDRLRQEVRCRSAAVAQLKEAREQRDADRIALVRAKEAAAAVALERDRLKRQVAAHKRAARSAASTPRSLADVPPRGRFPASSPVVNRRSAAASSDSSYSPGPSPRRRTPVKAGAHHLEPHPLLSGGGGDA